jgi:general secretion pathway protein K
MASERTMRSSRGFALIVVLWFLVLIAAMASYLVANARLETAIARNVLAAATAEALADAGVAQAVFNQSDPKEEARWALDGGPHVIRLADGDVTIRLFDERQKINPNRATDVLVAALFEAAGVERPLAQRIGASTADWVDRDTEPRPLGGERDQYSGAGRNYAPPNMPFESLDELQLVLGVTPLIFARVRPYLTIYTSAARPDGRNALAVVQRALLLAPQAPVQPDAAASTESGELQLTADERAAAEEAEAQALADAATASDDAPVLTLQVTAHTPAGGVFVRHAVLRIDPRTPKGYVVLDWGRGNLAPAPAVND